jgi:hypothetical protein
MKMSAELLHQITSTEPQKHFSQAVPTMFYHQNKVTKIRPTTKALPVKH